MDDDSLDIPAELARRAMVVRKAERVDVECVVRGYITGSAWEEYQEQGKVAGITLPPDLKEGDKFPEPLFTPATKAEEGHDENITVLQMEDVVGKEMTTQLAETSVAIYNFAQNLARERGIIIADTKFEYGLVDGEVTLIDEILTPDSSRFWDTVGYAPGKSQPNFDKQYVRDWLIAQSWNREPPAPALPDEVVEKTHGRYLEAFERLTEQKLK
jgi:phosphoribosylaminoimidazole-succinocarboxamide synthase